LPHTPEGVLRCRRFPPAHPKKKDASSSCSGSPRCTEARPGAGQEAPALGRRNIQTSGVCKPLPLHSCTPDPASQQLSSLLALRRLAVGYPGGAAAAGHSSASPPLCAIPVVASEFYPAPLPGQACQAALLKPSHSGFEAPSSSSLHLRNHQECRQSESRCQG